MTETDGGHLDLDALADLDQDLAPDPQAAAMRGHLAACPACSEQFNRIRTTRALLSALPPEQMPPAVAARIDAAIARAGDAAAGIVPLARRRPWWRRPAAAGLAAAAAVVLLVAGIVAGNVSSKSRQPSTAGADRNGASRPAGAGSAAAAASVKEWQTGANYTKANVPALAPRLVTDVPTGREALSREPSTAGSANQPAGAPASPGPSSTGPPGVTFAEMKASAQAVLRCGRALADNPTAVPLAVDFARFEGHAAVVVVLPTPADPSRVDVYILTAQPCSSASLFSLFRVAR